MTSIRELALAAPLQPDPPGVPIHPEIDYQRLVDGDPDPLFVTLAVARVGAVSQPPNGLLYDAELVSAIAAQGVGADALMGHLPDDQRDSAFPIDDRSSTPRAGVWVGFRQVDDMLWGKVYIPAQNERVRAYLRQLAAVGGALRTSIYGTGRYVLLDDGIRRLDEFLLESIDFAPAARAALELDGTFALTSEMDAPSGAHDATPRHPQSVEEGLCALPYNAPPTQPPTTGAHGGTPLPSPDAPSGAHDATPLPSPDAPSGEPAPVAELVTLRDEVRELRAAAYDRALDEAVRELTAGWRLPPQTDAPALGALHNLVRGRVRAQQPEAAALPDAVREVWRSDDIQALAGAVRDALAGPPAIVGGRKRADDGPDLRDLGARYANRRG